MADPRPLYRSDLVEPAYALRFAWTGWLHDVPIDDWPSDLFESIKDGWDADGLRLLRNDRVGAEVRLVFSTKPTVSPVLVAQRAKGRLAYTLRQRELASEFSRELAVRSLGENTAREVEEYIVNQVTAAQFVDPEFAKALKQFTIVFSEVDLSQPSEVNRGRYWYDLHLVLVTEERYRIGDMAVFAKIRDGCMAVSRKKGYRISRLSLMPDHIHVALRGAVEQSPAEIAGSFQNNLAYLLGQKPIWKETFDVGTFGQYNLNAIRHREA